MELITGSYESLVARRNLEELVCTAPRNRDSIRCTQPNNTEDLRNGWYENHNQSRSDHLQLSGRPYAGREPFWVNTLTRRVKLVPSRTVTHVWTLTLTRDSRCKYIGTNATSCLPETILIRASDLFAVLRQWLPYLHMMYFPVLCLEVERRFLWRHR